MAGVREDESYEGRAGSGSCGLPGVREKVGSPRMVPMGNQSFNDTLLVKVNLSTFSVNTRKL